MRSISIEDKEDKDKLISLGIGREEGNLIILNEIEFAYAVLNKIIEGDVSIAREIKERNNKLYSVYSFLFNRGYIPRFTEGEKIIRVGRKGYRRGEDRTYYLLRVINSINLEELINDLELAGKMRKELVYAILDGEKIKFISIGNKMFV